MVSPISNPNAIFLQGPAGSGKTTEAAATVVRLLQEGTPPEQILVLVSQRSQARVYQDAAHAAGAAGGAIEVLTYTGLALRAIEAFWPTVAQKAGFVDPAGEPVFLSIETAQFFMARLANPSIASGEFAGVDLPPPRVISQTLDNLNRAAMLGISLEDVAKRLIKAWGEGPSSRPPAYLASRDLGARFRTYCLDHNLIDYSLAIELFNKHLLKNRAFMKYFYGRYAHLIVDNVEEMNAAVHDFLKIVIPKLSSALIVYDSEGGYRFFLGAEPENAYDLTKSCGEIATRDTPYVMSPPIFGLVNEFQRILAPDFRARGDSTDAYEPGEVRAAFHFAIHSFYPQMVDWAADQVIKLVHEGGVAPREVAIIAPYLNDSLRFSLTQRLAQAGIAALSQRPSRPLRAEPLARALLTLAQIAYPQLTRTLPYSDVADALHLSLAGLDPLRARILAGLGFKHGALLPFANIPEGSRARITFRIGNRYDALRQWLSDNADPTLALDFFFQRLFGEMLSQPEFGLFGDVEGGRVVAQLIESTRRFRETLYPTLGDDAAVHHQLRDEYLALFDAGLLSGYFAPSWIEAESDAVSISPAYTFLMRNQAVSYQFWLDASSSAWSERIEQPLTHPYILRRENAGTRWNADLESEQERARLYGLISGLARRCRSQIVLSIADLSEEGFEQRGLLSEVFQQVLRRALAADPDQEETDG